MVGLRRTAEDVCPYNVSMIFFVGKAFMPSEKPSHGGRTYRFAPTKPPLPKGRWIFAKQKDGGIPQAGLCGSSNSLSQLR